MGYTVCKTRDNDSGEIANSGNSEDRLTVSFSESYRVLFDDDEPNPEQITPDQVLMLPEIPTVNETVYESAVEVWLYTVCRRKSTVRDPGNIKKWDVEVGYETREGSEDVQGQPLCGPTPECYPPAVTIRLGDATKALWYDYSGKPCWLPTGTLFDTPVIEQLATQIITIEQIENSITYDAMQSRKHKLNSAAYRGKSKGMWWMKDVQGVEIKVPHLDAGLSRVVSPAAKVTHVMELSPYSYGWADQRPLMDNYFLESANDLTTRKRSVSVETGDYRLTYLDADGTKRASQSGAPSYVEFDRHGEIDFNSFLRA